MPRVARALVLSVLASLAAVLGIGCAKHAAQEPPKLATAPPVPAAHSELPKPASPPAHPAPPPVPELNAAEFKDVYFDLDRSDLRDDARTALDGDAKLLRDHPGTKITLEGHCDERGTVEYNEALGERRADATKTYLVSSGVDAALIKTISYGKDRPLCTDHNEACWAKNRCAHFVVKPGPA